MVHGYRGETRTASQEGVEKDARGRIREEGGVLRSGVGGRGSWRRMSLGGG